MPQLVAVHPIAQALAGDHGLEIQAVRHARAEQSLDCCRFDLSNRAQLSGMKRCPGKLYLVQLNTGFRPALLMRSSSQELSGRAILTVRKERI